MTGIEDIKAVVQPIYQKILGHDALDSLSVEIAEDHAGEESIYVRARLVERLFPMELETYETLNRQAREAIRTTGDQRYAYLVFDFVDPVEVIDDAQPRRREARK